MKKLIWISATLFSVLFIQPYVAHSQGNKYTNVPSVDKLFSAEDVQKWRDADRKIEAANQTLMEAQTKVFEVSQKKQVLDKKKDQLKKAKANLEKKPKMKQGLAFKDKKKIKELEAEISDIEKKEKITEKESEIKQMLNEAESNSVNNIKQEIFRKYLNSSRIYASKNALKDGKLLEEQAGNQFEAAKDKRKESEDVELRTQNLADALELESVALNKMVKALEKYTTSVNDADEEKKEEERKVVEETNFVLTYKIQVLAVTKKEVSEKQLQRKLKSKYPIQKEQSDGWYKYTIGDFKSYTETVKTMESLKVSDAFIIAYKNGNRITIAEARRLSKE